MQIYASKVVVSPFSAFGLTVFYKFLTCFLNMSYLSLGAKELHKTQSELSKFEVLFRLYFAHKLLHNVALAFISL